jgi:hypothetical protein
MTLIVKHLVLNSRAGGVSTVTVGLATAGLVEWVYVVSTEMAIGSSELVDCWVVLQPGDVLTINATSFPLHYWISGTALTGVSSYSPPPTVRLEQML